MFASSAVKLFGGLLPSRRATVVLVACLCGAPRAAVAQERVASSAGLDFYSSFWMNLHHRLHADARDNKTRVDVSGWPTEDRTNWMTAIEFYARDLAQRDLRTGKDMTIISGRLSGAGDSIARLGLSGDHQRVLEAAASVYRKHLWPRDDEANRAWIADVTARFERIRARVLPRLEAFYRVPWYSESKRARIDIVYVGGARGGYTWIYPQVHSVIDAADAGYRGWLGVEMTLHEASHGMVDELTAALDSALRAAKKQEGILWHTVQFFVVGEIMKRTLAADGIAFTSYLYETGLFDRAWAKYKPHVEAIIGAWLDGRLEWHDAIAKLAAAI
jgi:hypothetical protein